MTCEDEIHQMLREMFCRARTRLSGHRVVIFGSRARGDARPRSDFDIARIGDDPLPLRDFHALADQIEDLPTLHRIDGVDLARTSEKFRRSALTSMKVIYEA